MARNIFDSAQAWLLTPSTYPLKLWKSETQKYLQKKSKEKTGTFGPCDTTGWLTLREDSSSSNQEKAGSF